MKRVVVIGSGASGVHFALTLLRKGYAVTMFDVGNGRPKVELRQAGFNALKSELDDPARYFLGEHFESVVYPGSETDYYTKYYGVPPTKNFVFSKPSGSRVESQGFEPLLSFARGGLAEAWTAGAYPLNDDDLRDFPIDYADLAPYYDEVAERIGINGADDDLARFYPVHANLLEPLELDAHSDLLVRQYTSRAARINGKLSCYLGRSRIATLTRSKPDRSPCVYCGRCLWGCPSAALYTPSLTLSECMSFDEFDYRPRSLVSHFTYGKARNLQQLHVKAGNGVEQIDLNGARVVLAAGTLSTSRIFLESIYQSTGDLPTLSGLMDNRQVLVPFVNPWMFGNACSTDSYQYHQLAVGIDGGPGGDYVHGQITTLKSAIIHPIVANAPLSLRASITAFRNMRAGLGVVNLNLCDRRRDSNFVALERDNDRGGTKLRINYQPDANEPRVIDQAVKRVKSVLRELGCFVPPGMVHVRPMGASVHYTGTVPMSRVSAPLTASCLGESHDFPEVTFVDGTTFPFLPAKNVTFSLMANAVRIADTSF
jgi:choline dehydrogenase-like flavoprotein